MPCYQLRSTDALSEWVFADPPMDVAGLASSLRRTVSFPEQFPDARIVSAFAQPLVSPSPPCSWGLPDVAGLREYCHVKVA